VSHVKLIFIDFTKIPVRNEEIMGERTLALYTFSNPSFIVHEKSFFGHFIVFVLVVSTRHLCYLI